MKFTAVGNIPALSESSKYEEGEARLKEIDQELDEYVANLPDDVQAILNKEPEPTKTEKREDSKPPQDPWFSGEMLFKIGLVALVAICAYGAWQCEVLLQKIVVKI